MARFVVCRPGVVVATVEAPIFQLLFGSTVWDKTPCFALQFAYTPSPMALMRPDGVVVPLAEFSRFSLFRLPINFAEDSQDLNLICKAANESETLENALTRVPEAFNLFNNNPRIRKGDVEQAGKDAAEIVKVAWGMRDWVTDGAKDTKRWDTVGSFVIGNP